VENKGKFLLFHHFHYLIHFFLCSVHLTKCLFVENKNGMNLSLHIGCKALYKWLLSYMNNQEIKFVQNKYKKRIKLVWLCCDIRLTVCLLLWLFQILKKQFKIRVITLKIDSLCSNRKIFHKHSSTRWHIERNEIECGVIHMIC
jgi:hypothetical protein